MKPLFVKRCPACKGSGRWIVNWIIPLDNGFCWACKGRGLVLSVMPTEPLRLTMGDSRVMDVARCPRCQGAHKAVVFHKLTRPTQDGSTYYGACPATNEPILGTPVNCLQEALRNALDYTALHEYGHGRPATG